jgi:hypothetical protein
MANKSMEDQVSVHHEDSTNSRGYSSAHNPIARRLFLDTDVIDSTTPVAVPTTTTSAPIAVIIGGILTYVANIRMTNPTPQSGCQPLQNPPVGTANQWPPAGNILPP